MIKSNGHINALVLVEQASTNEVYGNPLVHPNTKR